NVITWPAATASTRSMTSAPRAVGIPPTAIASATAPTLTQSAILNPQSPIRNLQSEGLPEADEPRRPRLARLPIDLRADVEAQRPDRRLVAQPGADRRPQLAEADVGGAREHVAGIDEADDAEAAGDGDAQLGVEQRQAVAA